MDVGGRYISPPGPIANRDIVTVRHAPQSRTNVGARGARLTRILMWIIAALLLAASIMGCNSKDPLDLLIEELEEAAENRDVNAFEKRLAADFTANDQIHREEALALLRRYFLAYERITVDVTKLERSTTGNRVNFQVSFSGNVNEKFNVKNLQNILPSTAVYHFDLRLLQEEGSLKVQKAFWKEISGP